MQSSVPAPPRGLDPDRATSAPIARILGGEPMSRRSDTLFRITVCLAALPAPLAAFAQNPSATITVNAQANRRAINPYIYGLAYATPTQLSDLNVTLNRYGGNNASRYNW